MRAEDVIETGQADDLICRTDAADDCRSHSLREVLLGLALTPARAK